MSTASSPSPRQNRLHRRYLAVLPRIVRHARCYFRWVKCFHTKEDKVQEVSSHCWKWVRLLHKARKKWWQFVSRLADYACRAVRSGRKVAGSIRISDIMNEINQSRKGYYISKLPDFSTESTNPLVEALTDNTVSPVPDQVAFRLDFPAWRSSYDDRRQRIIDALAVGHRTKDVAEKFQMSQGRVSQLRREFMADWDRWCSADKS
jgi:hypothetical protein